LFHDGSIHIAGAAGSVGFRAFKGRGVRTVIDVRLAEQVPPGYADMVRAEGMQYVNVPMRPDALTEEQAAAFRAAIRQAGSEPVLIHCQSGNRAAAAYGVYLGCEAGMTPAAALERAQQAGLKHPALVDDVRAYIEAHGGEGRPKP
jgi:uncharacterized protein (TIGR01244 family)